MTLDFNDNYLAEHGAKLAAGGGDAVEGAAVSGWECFGWDLGMKLTRGTKFIDLATLTMKVVVFGPELWC